MEIRTQTRMWAVKTLPCKPRGGMDLPAVAPKAKRQRKKSQLVFLHSSVIPGVPYQGQSMAAVPQGGPTWVQVIHYSHGSFSSAPLGMEWQETCAGETPHQGSWAYSHKQKRSQSLEQNRRGQSRLCTQFSENTLKIYFKYIIKGSPFNFKNTRHSINDSQFMKATTLKCYKSFTTPRY